MSKKCPSKDNALNFYRRAWERAPIGSEKESLCLKKVEEILRPRLNAAKTAGEAYVVYLASIKDSTFENEAWEKWNTLNQAEKTKRGES
jgi:hypothetical protein